MRVTFEWNLVEATLGVQLGEDVSTLDATKQMLYQWQYVSFTSDAVVQAHMKSPVLLEEKGDCPTGCP